MTPPEVNAPYALSESQARRAGALKRCGDGVVRVGRSVRANGPTREEAFDAFCTLLEFCAGRGTAPVTYDQRPGRLPPDAKSCDAFRRWHRAARRAGLAGVWTRGKLLVATTEAWATPLRTKAARLPPPPSSDDDAQLDAALGIRAARQPK